MYGPNRYICSVLDEMRDCYKSRNFSYIKGLIEEAQTLANRMEAALGDKSDVKRMLKQRDKLKKEIRELEEQQENLGKTKKKSSLTKEWEA